MTFNEFKNHVIAACEEMGITEYELYYSASESTSVETFRHEINEFTASRDGGVCFRCIVGGKMGYASTEDLSEAQAKAVVAKAADNAATLESEEMVFLGEGGQEYEPLEIQSYELPGADKLISAALDVQEKLYAADPMVIDGCQSQGLIESSEIAIYNSKGLDLHYQNSVTGLVAAAVVSDGKEMENSFEVKLGRLEEIDVAALADKAAAKAKVKLGGQVAPTGQYPVVFSPNAMCLLLGTYSGIFSSEAAQKGLSRLAKAEGGQIAAEIVTLVDDPFHKDNPMPINFDAEGSPTHKKNVIEKGKLCTLLYNLKTAAVAGKKTTGNASKAGYDGTVMVRPFTLYLENGDVSEEELLRQVGNGVYITNLGGLHAGANSITGDFSLQSAGFMIEDGVKTTAVKSFTVAGNFYDLLKNITALANNCQLPMAMGMTAFGSPSVRVDGLSIAGK